MLTKQEYINVYNNLVEEDKKLHIEEYGNNDAWDNCVVDEDIDKVDEVVGYYLAWYKERALKTWLDNLNCNGNWLSKEQDEEVTTILQRLL